MTTPIKLKVCGMRDYSNIGELVALKPDFMGFILYPGSKRYVGNDYSIKVEIPSSIKKTGVFVNELIKDVVNWRIKLNLDFVQLHGNESPEYCKEINELGLNIIKAFGITPDFDFNSLEEYIPFCNYFLFDTKTPIHGGSGNKFEWEILKNYSLELPFFLSGGIKYEDADVIMELIHPNLYALDINSGFEISPALKDIQLVNRFINKIRS